MTLLAKQAGIPEDEIFEAQPARPMPSEPCSATPSPSPPFRATRTAAGGRRSGGSEPAPVREQRLLMRKVGETGGIATYFIPLPEGRHLEIEIPDDA